jgi:biopolymer transport protein ExbD
LAAVEETLAALQEIDPTVPVVLDPERGVAIVSVLDVYDAARRVGLSKIQFAADPETLAR